MEKFKGTPGPWEYQSNEYDKFLIVAKSISRGQPIICDLAITTDYDRADEVKDTVIREHNANLIAAAPDLLEALIEARVWVQGWNAAHETEASEKALIACNKAIDRALGKNDGDK